MKKKRNILSEKTALKSGKYLVGSDPRFCEGLGVTTDLLAGVEVTLVDEHATPDHHGDVRVTTDSGRMYWIGAEHLTLVKAAPVDLVAGKYLIVSRPTYAGGTPSGNLFQGELVYVGMFNAPDADGDVIVTKDDEGSRTYYCNVKHLKLVESVGTVTGAVLSTGGVNPVVLTAKKAEPSLESVKKAYFAVLGEEVSESWETIVRVAQALEEGK